MLPGFRFLFAAILLSVSILVFGVGAAALLRATHEEFVANPSWRNGPQEQVFAQAPEPAQPVLAALRAEPVATEAAPPSLRDQIPTIGLPADEVEPTAMTIPVQESAPEAQLADTAPPQAPAEVPPSEEATIAPPAEPLASQAAAAETPPPVAEDNPVASQPPPLAAPEPQVADAVVAPPEAEAAPSAVQTTAPVAPAAVTDKAASPSKAKTKSAEPDKATKRRAHRPAKKRHRIARRPPQPPVQQTFDPFAQQQPPFATTATRAR